MESAKKETQAEEDGQERGRAPRGPTVPTIVPGVSQEGHVPHRRSAWEQETSGRLKQYPVQTGGKIIERWMDGSMDGWMDV